MELKRLARNARERLINKGEGGGIKKVTSPCSPNVKFKIISSEIDENFNTKAKQALENDSLSPIQDIMDGDYFNSLDGVSKQKYLLDVIEKFNRVKEKFAAQQEQNLVY